jgi:hypothetical protein
MKAHIECDVQLFVTEHKTEIDPRTGRQLKGYYVTMDFAGTTATNHKFKDVNDMINGFKDLDLQSNNWGRANQGDFSQGATSIPANETIKHYIGFRGIIQDNRYSGSLNRTFVYLQIQNLKEPQLLIFDKGISWDNFLSQIEGMTGMEVEYKK